jgi:hypothetical protein
MGTSIMASIIGMVITDLFRREARRPPSDDPSFTVKRCTIRVAMKLRVDASSATAI